MLATDLDALLPEQIAQYPTTRKRALQVHFVDLPHDGEVGCRQRFLGRQYTLQRLPPPPKKKISRACRASGELCERSITVLRSVKSGLAERS
ncbi:hypothetical protein [Sphingomonas panacis]|uniref:hypothetical protein n=1 Tax=Sphingomonas panacis TaxID=1560345 RepID=UPI0012378B37|nr:hypothetical protein [Sphingomonas panacis]